MKPKPLNVRMQGVLLAIGIHGIAVAREPANRKLLQEVYRADRFGLWREAYTELRAYRMSDDEINQIVAPIYSEPPPASSPDDYGTSKVIPIKTRAAGPKPNGHANRAEPHQGLPKEEVIAETTAAIEPGEKPKRPPKKDGKAATSEPAVVIIPAVVPPSIWPDHDKGGEPKRTYRNARFAIAALGVTCRLDLFHNRKLIGEHVVDRWAGQLSDSACYALRQAIIDAYGFDPGKDNTNDAAISLCIEHPFDPVMEYIDSLVWDGTQRLGIWLSYYLGAEDTPLNREIGKLVLVAAIRRARKPGTKFDHMLVLEGPEGRMKSTVILVLAGEDNFSDQTILGQRDKEQQELVAGVWLYEIPELAGMPKAEIEKVKAFITRTHDRARGAYERHRVDTPRRCIFIGTTNEDTYLRSQTGNRRFWPIKVGSIDIEALREDRDQLWAEAAKVEATGLRLVLPPELWADARAAQDDRLEVDPWDDFPAGVKGTLFPTLFPTTDGSLDEEERISSEEIFKTYLQIPAERTNWAMANRLKNVMRRLGWEGPKKLRFGDDLKRGYVRAISPPNSTNPLERAEQGELRNKNRLYRTCTGPWDGLKPNENGHVPDVPD